MALSFESTLGCRRGPHRRRCPANSPWASHFSSEPAHGTALNASGSIGLLFGQSRWKRSGASLAQNSLPRSSVRPFPPHLAPAAPNRSRANLCCNCTFRCAALGLSAHDSRVHATDRAHRAHCAHRRQMLLKCGPGGCSAQADASEAWLVAAEQSIRLEKHVQMRALIAWLVENRFRGKQTGFFL